MSLRPNPRMEIRFKIYKLVVDGKLARHKREENLTQIRKIKRQDTLNRKRSEAMVVKSACVDLHKELDGISESVSGIWTENPNLQLQATGYILGLLSINKSHSSIENVINAGVVPRLVEFLTWNNFPRHQYEAAWALTNIAWGNSEHVKVLIDNGAVPILVHLLKTSPSDDVREQAVLALGNIADDSSVCRDIVLGHGALNPLLAQLNNHLSTISMLRTSSWMLRNLCHGKPPLTSEVTKPALAALAVLIHLDDEEILGDTCWALYSLSGGTKDRIQDVIDSGVSPKLVELLRHPSSTIVMPALRTVANIISEDDLQTQLIINSGVLSCLLALVTENSVKEIVKIACWTISNITGGTQDQIQSVIDANIIAPLVKLLQTAEFSIKKEAAWAISNGITCGSHKQIKFMVDQGCLKSLCDLLVCQDPTVVSICLEGLESILNVGERDKESGESPEVNIYAKYVEDVGGLDKIENLQNHPCYDIYAKALNIVERYWDEDAEDWSILL